MHRICINLVHILFCFKQSLIQFGTIGYKLAISCLKSKIWYRNYIYNLKQI